MLTTRPDVRSEQTLRAPDVCWSRSYLRHKGEKSVFRRNKRMSTLAGSFFFCSLCSQHATCPIVPELFHDFLQGHANYCIVMSHTTSHGTWRYFASGVPIFAVRKRLSRKKTARHGTWHVGLPYSTVYQTSSTQEKVHRRAHFSDLRCSILTSDQEVIAGT